MSVETILAAKSREVSAEPQGARQTLAITHIFPRRINALPASPRSCPSVLSCLKALHVK
jgi:hypothetical protein